MWLCVAFRKSSADVAKFSRHGSRGRVPALMPRVIPADAVRLRAISALVSADLVFKLIDYLRTRRTQSEEIAYSEFCRLIVPFPFLLVVLRDKLRQRCAPAGWSEIPGFCGALAICCVGLAMMAAVSKLPLTKTSFLLDHILKLVGFVVFLEALARCLRCLERMFGFDAPLIINHMIRSRTVAEFWTRYNTRVHNWFWHNVFRPLRTTPDLAVIATFTVNGALHEMMFGIATSRFDGYQFLFFLIQIPAVLTSRHLRRFAAGIGEHAVGVLRCGTIVWLVATSMLFFHGVNRIVPFYTATPWLP